MIRSTGNAIARLTRGNGRVAIVNYHRVLAAPSPLPGVRAQHRRLHRQMELLARCFNVLPLRDALAAIDAGTVPPRAVCITFDDGYRSVHDLALPVLRRLKLPATVFVSSGYVNGHTMWNDSIVEAVETLPEQELDLAEFGLGVYSLRSMPERAATLGRLTEASKYLPPQERSRLVGRLQTPVGERAAEGLMLTPEMVVNLDRHGIEIGAHTVTHPILTSLDEAAAQQEISDSKRELEAIVGKEVALFAYPNGKVGKDFDARHVAMVRAAGFQAAFTTAVGAITRRHDRYQLPRSRPWDDTPFRFALRLLQWLARG
ncbi:polysaccharide deacetylase family protein [Massilia sp. Se16.2.3]|nr:polysaccharide deacetylase family protein [Massilia sp. Se16.2.3]